MLYAYPFFLISTMNAQLSELNKKGIDAAVRGDINVAEHFFRDAIQLDPKILESSFNLIKLFHINKRHHDAVLVFKQIVGNNRLNDLPLQVVNILSDCAINDRDLTAACDCCEILHNTFPGHIDTTCRFSNILIKTGQLGKAKFVLKQSNIFTNSDPNLLTQLAIVESELGNYSRAEEIHLHLINVYATKFLSNYNYGLFLSMLGRNDEALEYFNRCLKIVPDAPEALSAIKKLAENRNSNLSSIYESIESEMYDEAIAKLKKSKDFINPIYYWAALGDIPTKFASLIDDVDLVSPYIQIECLDLFENLDEQISYLLSLEECVKSQESLIWDRAGKPTRFGRQSHELLLGSQNEYIINLNSRLRKLINKYILSRPFLVQMAQQKGFKEELSGWAVSLAKGGYQKRHIHPEAVVSGVLYIKLLDESRSCSQNEGNLLFSSSHGSRMITPKEGMVVLFPSYLAHETVPLVNDKERLCIAFNFQ